MKELRGNFIINDDTDEVRLKGLLNMDASLDKISVAYHKLTGGEVIDHRCDKEHEYTNVDAQDDPDFWEEELINDELTYRTV